MFDINSVKTPCYVISEQALAKNLEILDGVMSRTGCRILLALWHDCERTLRGTLGQGSV